MKQKSCFSSLIPMHFGIVIIFTVLFNSCSEDPTKPTSSVPELTTAIVSTITSSTATCGGTITSEGGASVTARGVCWSTSQTPTVSDNKTNDGDGSGNFTSEMSGLSPETKYYVRAYATNSAGTGYGSAMTFTTLGTVTDVDGNVYQTVKIGNQWWMKENLKVTKYRNGDDIQNVTDNTAWSNLSAGAYCAYDNNNGNIATYGLLYNWYAVDDSRNIAPAGWHVPTDEEYTALENYLIANGYNWDGTTTEDKTGKSLASKTGWKASGNAGDIGNDMSTNNSSGFSALPGGSRYYVNGTFGAIGGHGFWWSATEYSSVSAWHRYLDYDSSVFGRYAYGKLDGFSLRLVRD